MNETASAFMCVTGSGVASRSPALESAIAAETGVQPSDLHEVLVREDAALRLPGGSRGVEKCRFVAAPAAGAAGAGYSPPLQRARGGAPCAAPPGCAGRDRMGHGECIPSGRSRRPIQPRSSPHSAGRCSRRVVHREEVKEELRPVVERDRHPMARPVPRLLKPGDDPRDSIRSFAVGQGQCRMEYSPQASVGTCRKSRSA